MSRITIAIADDNPAVLRQLTEYFAEKSDVEVVGVAQDGKEALELVERKHPRILISDIIMPRMDGFGLLDGLRGMPDAPRALMISGLSRECFIERALKSGAYYYMIKPLDVPLLYERVLEIAAMEENEDDEPALAPARTADAEEQIANLFLSIGIPAHIKGYQYLREAVRMAVQDHGVMSRITKELYPGVARRFSTSASKVERAMRHAIEVAWNRGRLDNANRMYGCKLLAKEDKPTNGEFIALVADKVRARRTA